MVGISDNPLRRMLEDTPLLVGAILSFPAPQLVEFLGYAGFDWVFLDGEHGGISPEDCYTFAAAARSVGMATVARVPVNQPDVIVRFADAGVDGIVAPHIDDALAVRRLLDATWFPPLGTRGMATSTRAGGYGLTQTAAEFVGNDKLRPVAIAMIEDAEAFDHIDEILDEPRLEAAWLGAGDLSASLGIPAQSGDPRVRSLLRQGVDALHTRGQKVILSSSDIDSAATAIDLGADMVVVPAGKLLASAALKFVAATRELGAARDANYIGP